MKIIHTSDWHLGNIFHGYDRHAEHRAYLERLLALLADERPDALLVAGDVFDTSNPSAAAEELLYDFLDRATALPEPPQVVLIAGNHDSPARLEAPAPLLRRRGVTVVGSCVGSDGRTDPERLLVELNGRGGDRALLMAVPYLRPSDLPAGCSYAEGLQRLVADLTAAARKRAGRGVPLLLMAHLYATGAELSATEPSERLVVGGQECVDASKLVPPAVRYVALGHIHKQQTVGGREWVRYAGSALPMSFGERGYRHGVCIVQIDGDEPAHVSTAEIEPLRRLMSIPARGESCTAQEALTAIEALPRAKAGDDRAAWPYLEVKITQTEPDPTLPARLSAALEGRAVLLCRVERVAAESAVDGGPAFASIQRIKRLTPLDMARILFKEQKGTDMPPQLEALFEQAEQSLEPATATD